MEITSFIDSKAIIKLIDVVSNGIGTLYRPRQIKKEADAEAYAIKVKAKAEAEAAAEKRMIEIETDERIAQRLAAKEIRRQENIDFIVERAALILLEKGTISDKPVDVDWATRFFEYAQDISMEEMKNLWAKILAQEVESPSSFSLRTLDVLRNITAEEARTFVKVAQFVLHDGNTFLLGDESILKQMGVSYLDLSLLVECGILQPTDLAMINYPSSEDEDTVVSVFNGKYWIKLTIPKQSGKASVIIRMVSKVGCELLKLVELEGNQEYVVAFASSVKKSNPAMMVQYAVIDEESLEGDLKNKTPFVTV